MLYVLDTRPHDTLDQNNVALPPSAPTMPISLIGYVPEFLTLKYGNTFPYVAE